MIRLALLAALAATPASAQTAPALSLADHEKVVSALCDGAIYASRIQYQTLCEQLKVALQVAIKKRQDDKDKEAVPPLQEGK